ncbi:hypothetical protein ACGFNP_20010 [Nonomuraea sp. NPDC049269]|uniref:hypothetical protein n=1 Tax=Nonomuraea sp. NPDC049269 TaxID=3364349 RepID=UPI00371DA729
MIFDLSILLRIGLAMAIPAVFACASVTVAALSAPQNRHVRIRRRYVIGGLFLSFIGVCMMAFGAWSAREDSRYDGLILIGLVLVTLIGGGLLLLGFGPFASRLLESSVGTRNSYRCPFAWRPATWPDVARLRLPRSR